MNRFILRNNIAQSAAAQAALKASHMAIASREEEDIEEVIFDSHDMDKAYVLVRNEDTYHFGAMNSPLTSIGHAAALWAIEHFEAVDPATWVQRLTIVPGQTHAVKIGNSTDAGGARVERMELIEVDHSGFISQYYFASQRGLAVTTIAPKSTRRADAGEYFSCTCLYPLPDMAGAVKKLLSTASVEDVIAAGEVAEVIATTATKGSDDVLVELATV